MRQHSVPFSIPNLYKSIYTERTNFYGNQSFHSLVFLNAQATAQIAKEYRDRMTMATVSDVYIVDIDRLISPVAIFAYRGDESIQL